MTGALSPSLLPREGKGPREGRTLRTSRPALFLYSGAINFGEIVQFSVSRLSRLQNGEITTLISEGCRENQEDTCQHQSTSSEALRKLGGKLGGLSLSSHVPDTHLTPPWTSVSTSP